MLFTSVRSTKNHSLTSIGILILLSACAPEESVEEKQEKPVRGLITTLVDASAETTIRRYPGVLQPGEVNILSMKVGGRTGKIDLAVGQRITKGQVLAELDSEQFKTAIESREAAVVRDEATLAQAQDDLERAETLLKSGTVTRVRRDEAKTTVTELTAQLVQAKKALAEAQQDLLDTVLVAPFDGIVSAVEVESFATVSSGQPVLSVYQAKDFEVSFSVSFDVVSRLVVGTPANIRLADDPDNVLKGVVSELGERAGTVSSFPVVITLSETSPIIKAGMAVEVAFEFALLENRGFLIPTSAAIKEGQIPEGAGPNSRQPLPIFVFDQATGTVKRRTVYFTGIRENQFLVTEGLELGERVAVKGVSFLREGMEVKLIEREE
ncbi:MAG: efflux RND transporter periplasmic adaptor subunit [Pseudomonadota bacterium]